MATWKQDKRGFWSAELDGLEVYVEGTWRFDGVKRFVAWCLPYRELGTFATLQEAKNGAELARAKEKRS